VALLSSADQSYAAALESYQAGVRNLLDVVSAQKALAQARSVDIYTRTQLLTQLANLAFRTGDLIQAPPTKVTP
jgi:outer membrane protein